MSAKRAKKVKKIIRRYRGELENHKDRRCNLGEALYLIVERFGIKKGYIIKNEEEERMATAKEIYSQPERLEEIKELLARSNNKKNPLDLNEQRRLFSIARELEPKAKIKEIKEVLEIIKNNIPFENNE